MEPKSYKTLFSKLPAEEAPAYVVHNIEAKIGHSKRRESILRGTSYAVITCLAISACVPTFRYMADAMAGSGFTSYASILLTSGTSLLGSWKELGMALVESLPILSVTAAVTLIAGSIYSLFKSMSYIKSIKTLQA